MPNSTQAWPFGAGSEAATRARADGFAAGGVTDFQRAGVAWGHERRGHGRAPPQPAPAPCRPSRRRETPLMLTTIKSKVTAAGLAMLAVCGLTASAGLYTAVSMNGELKAAQDAAALTRSHLHADMMHDAIREDVLQAVLSKDPLIGSPVSEAKESLEKDAAAFATDVAAGKGLARDPGVKSALAALDAPIGTYVESARAAVEAAQNNP